MIIIELLGKPYPLIQFSTDDFGTEVFAVASYRETIDRNQAVIGQETWMHLFDMEVSIHTERHYAEAECTPSAI